MTIITSTDEAEEAAKQWMKQKYSNKVGKVRFSEVTLQDGVWFLKANVEMRTGVLETKPRTLTVRIEADTSKVVGYSENPGTSQP